MTDESAEVNSKAFKFFLMLILAMVMVVTVFVRIRMLAAPLERDEGEYAYAGQLMLQGVPPYQLAYNMKMPGIYAAYAAIMAVFGQNHLAIHFGVLLINAASIILIYYLSKKLFGKIAATAAAVFFAITSMSINIQATANAENFVVLPAIAAILLLVKFAESQKIWQLIFGGLLMGVAFMMKQHGIGFILFGYCFLFLKLLPLRQPPCTGQGANKLFTGRFLFPILVYSFFVILPFLVTCVILWQSGVFGKFWFWTFDYARHYVSLNSYADGFGLLKETLSKIVPSAVFIWLLGLAGLIGSIYDKRLRKHRVFLITFLICSFLSLCPGLYFRNHYFVLFLPMLSILAGAGVLFVSNIFKSDRKRACAAALVILLAWSYCFLSQRKCFMLTDPEMISRVMYGGFPFPETLRVAEYIKARSNEDDKIVVFGSEPQIYFYSQRRSATSFIYTYPLMENQPFAVQMQQEMISQIEAGKPRFIVVVKTVDSWMPFAGCSKLIFQWADSYFPEHYRQIALVEIFKEKGEVVYHWDSDVKPQKPESWIMILKRVD
ncbi:MAG: glycosyltransferase family 39 protein [Planctomycetaceae bacterium]|nr:glycosyltransferase family 39 protein [Planctomycetaceae bacterium]